MRHLPITEICERYLSGESSRAIARVYNVDKSLILNRLRKSKINVRKSKDCCATYSFDISYFDSIDREDKAYFLGYLYADGCNRSDGYGVVMNLAEQDKCVLDSFKEHIKSNKPLIFLQTKKRGGRINTG